MGGRRRWIAVGVTILVLTLVWWAAKEANVTEPVQPSPAPIRSSPTPATVPSPTIELAPSEAACGFHCGTKRWAVKTLTDQDHVRVDFTPQDTTVAKLVSLERPVHLPRSERIEPTEIATFRVHTYLLGFKWEAGGDQDFHIVIADLEQPDKTMIVEIPDPACADVCASDHRAEIQNARGNFIAHCGQPSRHFQRLQSPLPVVVTGVGFFDFLHGQIGVADNGIELHPVLGFEFPDDSDQCARLALP